MNAYDTIYDVAAENYGLITTKQAEELGVSAMSLVMLAKRGRLRHVGRGVYRLDQFPEGEYDGYAAVVTRAGDGAYLWGPSVLALDRLCPTDPSKIYVASPVRIRRQLGRGVVVKPGSVDARVEYPHGIPSQALEDAVRASRVSVMPERLRDAVDRAEREGLLPPETCHCLREELNHAH